MIMRELKTWQLGIINLIVFGLFIGGLLFSGGCSKFVPVRTKCPPDPSMKKVDVKEGTISGEDLDNVIENHINLWGHIHVLKKTGCTE